VGCAILDGQNRTSGFFSRTRRRVFVFPLATTDPTRDFWPAGYDGASASPDFGNGFLSAGVAEALSGKIGAIQGAPQQIIVASLIGGTVSAATGGKFANGAVTSAFAYTFASVARQNSANRTGDVGQEGAQPADVDAEVCTTLVCRPTSVVAHHCGTFVSGCGNPATAKIEMQFSLQGGATTFDPQGSTSHTYETDLAAFRNPGGSNLHYSIAAPSGMSARQFADSVIFYGSSYQAPRYGLMLGPNSNSAAAYPLFHAGAQVPNVPRAPALHYYDRQAVGP